MHSLKNKKEASIYEGDIIKTSNLSVSMERVGDSNFGKLVPKTHAKPIDNGFIVHSTPSKLLANTNGLQNIQKQRKRASHKKAFKCNWNLEEVNNIILRFFINKMI